jgi:hypothetical protein
MRATPSHAIAIAAAAALGAACGSSSHDAADAAAGTTIDARPIFGDGPWPDIDAAPASPPDWSTELPAADLGLFDVRHQPAGSVTLGVADPAAPDQIIARLILAGDPALGSADHASPSFASEIATQRTFQYGTFRTQVRLATCAPGEEAVNGLFVFANDGQDHNGNQIADNDEIDIEILCGTPGVLFLSSWTDYEDASGAFRKLTREVDLNTGDVLESINDHEYDLAPKGTDPTLKRPDALKPGALIEVGWTWRADELRFFLVDGGHDVTLWDLKDAAHIPVHATQWMWNIWHSPTHWFDNKTADYPAHDAVLDVDWARYWKN